MGEGGEKERREEVENDKRRQRPLLYLSLSLSLSLFLDSDSVWVHPPPAENGTQKKNESKKIVKREITKKSRKSPKKKNETRGVCFVRTRDEERTDERIGDPDIPSIVPPRLRSRVHRYGTGGQIRLRRRRRRL